MSVSSNSRKESTESFAAQRMHNTMGIPPALGQLNDQNLVNDLPSRVAESSDTDVPEDEIVAEVDAAIGDDEEAQAAAGSTTTKEKVVVPPAHPDESVRTAGNS